VGKNRVAKKKTSLIEEKKCRGPVQVLEQNQRGASRARSSSRIPQGKGRKEYLQGDWPQGLNTRGIGLLMNRKKEKKSRRFLASSGDINTSFGLPKKGKIQGRRYLRRELWEGLWNFSRLCHGESFHKVGAAKPTNRRKVTRGEERGGIISQKGVLKGENEISSQKMKR